MFCCKKCNIMTTPIRENRGKRTLPSPEAINMASKKMKLTKEEKSALMAELKSDILKDLTKASDDHTKQLINVAVKEALDALSIELDKEVEDLVKKNKALEDRVARLEGNEKSMAEVQESEEQYSRRNNVRIRGVDVSPTYDNTDAHVISLGLDMGVTINREHIDRSHRIGEKHDIIVKFTSYRFKEEFLAKRKRLRHKREGVWINEDLTRTRSHLLYEARRRVRAKSLNSAYTLNGNVFVHTTTGQRLKINRVEDLSQYSTELPTPEPALPTADEAQQPRTIPTA